MSSTDDLYHISIFMIRVQAHLGLRPLRGNALKSNSSWPPPGVGSRKFSNEKGSREGCFNNRLRRKLICSPRHACCTHNCHLVIDAKYFHRANMILTLIIIKSFWNQLLNVQFIVSKFKYHVTKIFYWIRLWRMFCHTLTHLVSYSFMQCHLRWQWQRFMTNMWHPFNMKLIWFGKI